MHNFLFGVIEYSYQGMARMGTREGDNSFLFLSTPINLYSMYSILKIQN